MSEPVQVEQQQNHYKNIKEEELKESWETILKSSKNINGCSKTPDLFQILSYILILATTLCMFTAVVPIYKSLIAQVVAGIVYCLSLIVLAMIALKLMVWNVSEPHTVKTKFYLERGIRIKFQAPLNHMCPICDSLVGENVHHCKQCNRCVKDLDHHCRWINNCINKENYSYFIFLLYSLFGYLLVSVAMLTSAVVVVMLDQYPVQYGQPLANRNFVIAPCATLVCIKLIIIGLALKLYFFHLWLMRNNMTTLEYIMKQREKEEKSNKVKPKMQSKIQPNKEAPQQPVSDTERMKFRLDANEPTTKRQDSESKDSKKPSPETINSAQVRENPQPMKLFEDRKVIEKQIEANQLKKFKKGEKNSESEVHILSKKLPELKKKKQIAVASSRTSQDNEAPNINNNEEQHPDML